MTGKLRDDLFEGSDPNVGVTAPRGTTKARIERAALQLFARHGMDGVSIKQIAQACTISDGAMYRHFKSKDDLARLMFEAIHARLLQLVDANIANWPRAIRRNSPITSPTAITSSRLPAMAVQTRQT